MPCCTGPARSPARVKASAEPLANGTYLVYLNEGEEARLGRSPAKRAKRCPSCACTARLVKRRGGSACHMTTVSRRQLELLAPSKKAPSRSSSSGSVIARAKKEGFVVSEGKPLPLPA